MLALLNQFWVKNPPICRGGWTERSPHCSSPCCSPYQVLRDLQLQDGWEMQGLNSTKDGSVAFSRLFPHTVSQPDTGLQHVTASNPLTLELPLSGYYGCRGRIPSHHLPPECGALPGRVPTPGWPSMGHSLCRWSRGPAHTVWHRPGSPRVPPG